jgi:O-antigen/teichoic acid export membrane protein
MIVSRLKLLQQSRFVRDAAWQSAGGLLAQFIVVLTLPILTRVFTPAEFGNLSFFLQVITFTSIFLTFRFEYLLQLPSSNEVAIAMALHVTAFAAAAATVVTVFLCVFPNIITAIVGNPTLANWLPLVAVAALFSSASVAAQALIQRQQKYHFSGMSEVVNKATYVGTALAAAALWHNSISLMLATLAGLAAKSFWLASKISDVPRLGRQTFKVARIGLYQLRGMSLSLMYSHVMLAVTSGLPIVYIAQAYGEAKLGQFTLAFSTLYLPASLIGAAIGQVFSERASKRWNTGQDFNHLAKSTLFVLFGLSIPVFAVIAWLSPILYPLVFGAAWSDAGRFARVMSLSSAAAFISTPLDRSSIVVNSRYYLPAWHTARSLTTAAIVVYSKQLKPDIESFILLITLQMTVMYGLDCVASLVFSKLKKLSPT